MIVLGIQNTPWASLPRIVVCTPLCLCVHQVRDLQDVCVCKVDRENSEVKTRKTMLKKQKKSTENGRKHTIKLLFFTLARNSHV